MREKHNVQIIFERLELFFETKQIVYRNVLCFLCVSTRIFIKFSSKRNNIYWFTKHITEHFYNFKIS